MRVLITGVAGSIGRRVAVELTRHGHAVSGFDRVLAPEGLPHVVGELTDARALAEAVRGVEAIVHLAATPDRADFVEDLVPNNIVGAYHLFEAARLANVRRVVFASSARVATALDAGLRGRPISVDDGYHPGDFYALTKCCGELMAQMYSEKHGIAVICARIGWFVRDTREARELGGLPHLQDIYLSHRDALSFFVAALAGESVGFERLFVTSYNGGKSRFDLEPGRRVIGYEPRDTWPEGSSWEDG
jgi:uronate dehydrogenase